ncbi:hypothetical protein MNBD_GAMMA09-3121 [hydrothermal vent metagenome]|uniref:EamA domain-containing protein n=1 Tax=hydrothermal vent metagenome TaxID=652676 RepID=A0A3B0XUP2_9ZZZZ
MDSKNSLGILYMAVFLLALNGLFSKLIPLDAVTITQLRSVLAAVSLTVFALLLKREPRLETARQYSGVYFTGVILGLHWITFFHSMQVSTVAIGMLSLFTYPVITVVLEAFFNKKRVSFVDVIAAVLVLLGVLIMVKEDLHQLDSDAVQGVFWGVISALLFSVRNLLQKYCFPSVPSDRLILHQVIVVAVLLFVFIDFSSVARLQVNDWFMLILLGAISTAAAHSLLSFSLKHISAKSTAMISCLQPLFAAVFAWLFLSETPTQSVVLGGLIIISVALYESLKKAGVKIPGKSES